ncbi:hypothetical protein MTR67_041566 [Solanum verrucosum]|uniref:S-protein homolog n=1 Tax=Solanum verrucosum TaxID=315347 RepID=A0AAF0ZQX0_SOLVR|nr:hypothetical protein MTR67_041566 [Solanum verrucosum]
MPYNIQSYDCQKHEVHILNDLLVSTVRLKIHCASADDDLGYNFVDVGKDFNWEFCATERTLFFCHFWWGAYNSKVFDVYNDLHYCVHDGEGYVEDFTKKCFYKVQIDGFYLGYYSKNDGQILYKKYRDW